jgi:ABC-2 type transport system permease protein
MAHPLLYDIRKVLLSKTVLISMALLIAISFFLIYSFSVSTTSSFQNNTEVLSWYDNSGTYHFFVFETNQYGQAISGVALRANLTVSLFSPNKGPITNPGSYPSYAGPSVTTNSSGEAQFTINVPVSDMVEVNANYTVLIQIAQPNGFSTSNFGSGPAYSQTTTLANGSMTYVPVASGQIVIINGNAIQTVTDSSNSQKENVLVTWAGPNGSLPKDYSLYYTFFNETEICSTSQFGQQCNNSFTEPSTLSESNMTFLSNMTSYSQVFNPPKLESNLGNGSQIAFAVFSPNGTVAIPFQYNTYPVNELYPSSQVISQGTAQGFVVSFFTEIYGIFIPLIAIIGSYNSYGKDRVSGVLESILAQPISRRGLSLSRFISSFAGMAIAISISMGVVDAIVYFYTKSPFSSTILLASAGAFFVELGTFIGIMMLLSRIIKSSGLLIGIGIGLFLVFDLFWSIIILAAVSASGAGLGSNAYQGFQIAGEFLNPAQFVQLVITYLTSQGSFGLISPAQYGITLPSLVATGILWVALPLAGFLYLAIKRD